MGYMTKTIRHQIRAIEVLRRNLQKNKQKKSGQEEYEWR